MYIIFCRVFDMNGSDIVIDLGSDDNGCIRSETELVQSESFFGLCEKIFKDLKDKENKFNSRVFYRSSDDDDLYPPGSGLTYFIDGTRGAGKSTFLNFIYKNLNEFGIKKKTIVVPLLYLDPSRIESSEIMLLHVLKSLKRLMEQCPYQTQDYGKSQERFRDLFKEMAGGLHLFVSDSYSLKELDSELFLDYGLDRAADSQKLRRVLHETIELVCIAYKANALILAIDDADTKFSNAIEILECIRKYLDMPKIVIVVTGDMEMYSLLVQNHFQQDFALRSQGFSSDRKIQQSRMVAHLEEQYLLKLFPVQRRIQLKTLYTLLERRINSESTFFVRGFLGDQEMSLLKAVSIIGSQGLYLRDGVDIDLFCEHVLKLPIRSVLQLLTTYSQLNSDSGISASGAAADAFRDIALSSLYQYDVQVESIAEGDLYAVINAAFDLCQLDGELNTAIYLRPQSRDANLRNSYVSLAADMAHLCEKNPAKAITYMVSTAGSINLLHLVLAKNIQRSGGRGGESSVDENNLQRKVKQYLSVGRKDDALNWALHATAALIGVSASIGLQLRQGVIGVRTSGKNSAVTFDAKIAEVINRKQEEEVRLPTIIFSQSAVKRPSNTQRYVSIFNMLGLISSLLELDGIDPDLHHGKILKKLNKIKSVQTVSLPNWDDSGRNLDVNEVDESLDDGNFENKKLNCLVDDILSWLEACGKLKNKFHPSAVLMGKIWNRFYFSLDNISAAMRGSGQEEGRVSKAMELFAWSLINASLIEEVDYHYRPNEEEGDKVDLNRYNPRTSGAVVMGKFQYSEDENFRITVDMAPLAFMLASCPLILGLIKRDRRSEGFVDDLNKGLKLINSEFVSKSMLCDSDLWKLIGETTVSE